MIPKLTGQLLFDDDDVRELCSMIGTNKVEDCSTVLKNIKHGYPAEMLKAAKELSYISGSSTMNIIKIMIDILSKHERLYP